MEFVDKKGEVTFITSFVGAFVERHTEAEAREAAARLCPHGAMGVYRIELLEVYEPPLPAPKANA